MKKKIKLKINVRSFLHDEDISLTKTGSQTDIVKLPKPMQTRLKEILRTSTSQNVRPFRVK